MAEYKLTFGDRTLTFPQWNGYVSFQAGTQYTYTTLWETNTPFKNLYSITLTDSIDNYDEFIVYGSAFRDSKLHIQTQNRYVVNHNGANQCGVNYAGRWAAPNSFLLANGTDMWVEGTSGYITSSYYIGEGPNTTSWIAALRNNSELDVHPYKIVGIKEIE